MPWPWMCACADSQIANCAGTDAVYVSDCDLAIEGCTFDGNDCSGIITVGSSSAALLDATFGANSGDDAFLEETSSTLYTGLSPPGFSLNSDGAGRLQPLSAAPSGRYPSASDADFEELQAVRCLSFWTSASYSIDG